MSDAAKQTRVNPKAEIVQFSASEWLERRERGDWNNRDQEEFDTWLAASPAHLIAYIRVEDIWNRANRLSALNRPERKNGEILKRWVSVERVAAIFAVVILSGIGVNAYLFAPSKAVYATGIGQQRVLSLADGSKIELNTNTMMRIAVSDLGKTVTLEHGEAYFDIKHDTNRVFAVQVGTSRVVDLGTKFLISRNSDQTRVSVFEGRAQFQLTAAGTSKRSVVLVPGDVVTTVAGKVVLEKVSSVVLTDDLAWRRGELAFHFTTLAAAVTEFNRYNQKKLVIESPEVARMEIGGTFGLHDVAGFSRQVRQLLGVRVDDRGDDIVLSR
jgi:transmembrane sensor